MEEYLIPAEAIPDLNQLDIEDDRPVDNVFAEKQQRLLTEPLYSSWSGPGEKRPFEAFANVGLFYQMNTPGLAPDIMLSVDVSLGADLSRRENRSYFIWELGKPPDVLIEPQPEQLVKGQDVQLDKAVEVLLADVVEWKKKHSGGVAAKPDPAMPTVPMMPTKD